MWAWLNPANLIKIFSLLQWLVASGAALFKWIKGLIVKNEQKKEIQNIQSVEQKVTDANLITDDQTRLAQKAEAACELEKSLDPNHKC